jgi:hypothetical protein
MSADSIAAARIPAIMPLASNCLGSRHTTGGHADRMALEIAVVK